jgi:hypothetical protein
MNEPVLVVEHIVTSVSSRAKVHAEHQFRRDDEYHNQPRTTQHEHAEYNS